MIAEAGVNHEGKLDLAYKLIDDAAEAGADAIKFQTYRAGSLASKNSPAYWDTSKEPTTSQYELFKKYDKFWKDEFEQLKVRCEKTEIEFLSTPFDIESATFLNDLMSVFKISSSDITNRSFIEYLARFGKPIILSTGASNLNEIDRALGWVGKDAAPVALLHCVLNYPTENENANLAMISGLKEQYPDRLIGYSDHTVPGDMQVLETAWLLGARILEKHFTFDKTLEGNDHYHAMDKEDLRGFLKRVNQIAETMGQKEKHSLAVEETARINARRSLVAACQVEAGRAIQPEMLTAKRPAHGISPAQIDEVVGRKLRVSIEEDEILTWEHLIASSK